MFRIEAKTFIMNKKDNEKIMLNQKDNQNTVEENITIKIEVEENSKAKREGETNKEDAPHPLYLHPKESTGPTIFENPPKKPDMSAQAESAKSAGKSRLTADGLDDDVSGRSSLLLLESQLPPLGKQAFI